MKCGRQHCDVVTLVVGCIKFVKLYVDLNESSSSLNSNYIEWFCKKMKDKIRKKRRINKRRNPLNYCSIFEHLSIFQATTKSQFVGHKSNKMAKLSLQELTDCRNISTGPMNQSTRPPTKQPTIQPVQTCNNRHYQNPETFHSFNTFIVQFSTSYLKLDSVG